MNPLSSKVHFLAQTRQTKRRTHRTGRTENQHERATSFAHAQTFFSSVVTVHTLSTSAGFASCISLAQLWKANMAARLLEQRVGNKLQFLRCTIRVFHRSLCAVATEEKLQAHQTGIPLIVPPHVVAKAFIVSVIVHPSTTSAFDASSKYQWLTKTKLFEGLPAPFSNIDPCLNDEEYVSLKQKIMKSVLQNYAFRKEGKSRNHRFEQKGEEIRLGVLQDLLRFGWSFSDRFLHLNDCFLDFKPKIRIHWVRHHNFYQLDQQPAYVIRTTQRIPLFEQGK